MKERMFEVVESYGEKQAVVAKYMNLDTALVLIHALVEKYYREDFFLAIRPMPFCQGAPNGE